MRLIRDPQTVGNLSDGGAHGKMFCGTGDNIWLLTEYVRDREMLTIEEGVHALTGKLAGLLQPAGARRDQGGLRSPTSPSSPSTRSSAVPRSRSGTCRTARAAGPTATPGTPAPMRLTLANGVPDLRQRRLHRPLRRRLRRSGGHASRRRSAPADPAGEDAGMTSGAPSSTAAPRTASGGRGAPAQSGQPRATAGRGDVRLLRPGVPGDVRGGHRRGRRSQPDDLLSALPQPGRRRRRALPRRRRRCRPALPDHHADRAPRPCRRRGLAPERCSPPTGPTGGCCGSSPRRARTRTASPSARRSSSPT